MTYEAKVVSVMIACPSDVEKVRFKAQDVIAEWNATHSRFRKLVLVPLHWETHASPEFGVEGQKVIDEQVLRHADLLVAIFGHRLGSPTSDSLSGTVSELTRHVKSGKHALVYFTNAPVPQEILASASGIEQFKLLNAFKEQCKNMSLYWTYDSPDKFKESFANHLSKKINEYHPLESGPMTDSERRITEESSSQPARTKVTVKGSFSPYGFNEYADKSPVTDHAQSENNEKYSADKMANIALKMHLQSGPGELVRNANGKMERYHHLLISPISGGKVHREIRVVLLAAEEVHGPNKSRNINIPSGLVLQIPSGLTIENSSKKIDLGYIREGSDGFWVQLSGSLRERTSTVKAKESLKFTFQVQSNAGVSEPLPVVISWDGVWKDDDNEMSKHLSLVTPQ